MNIKSKSSNECGFKSLTGMITMEIAEVFAEPSPKLLKE